MLLFIIILSLLATLAHTAAITSRGTGQDVARTMDISATPHGSRQNMSDTTTASTLDYDPSEDWHDYSMTQVWLGKDQVTVGNLIGFPLYTRISTLLNLACPEGSQNGRKDCYPGLKQTFQSHCLFKMPSDTVTCYTDLWVSGRYHSQAIRRNLIIAAAGAFQAQTSVEPEESGSNCFYVGAQFGGTMCTVGDVVRVHFPDQRGEINGWNYLDIKVYNRWSENAVSKYNCCRGEGRRLNDQLMNNIQDDVSALFPWMKYR